jgi:CRISPR-associated protein Cas6
MKGCYGVVVAAPSSLGGAVELLRVSFPVNGAEIPLDHGYALFSAISRLIPEIHRNREVAIAPIRGEFKAPISLKLTSFSRLTFIAPLGLIPDLFALCGKVISIGESPVLLGRMTLSPIAPCESVGSRLVAFSFPDQLEITADNFLGEVRRQLGIVGIEAEPVLGKRRVFKVKGFKQVGYGLRLDGLSPVDSLRLQTDGLGGHRRFGCGVFTPIRKAVSP